MTTLQDKVYTMLAPYSEHTEDMTSLDIQDIAIQFNKAIQELREEIQKELFTDEQLKHKAPRKDFNNIAWNEALRHVLALIGEKK